MRRCFWDGLASQGAPAPSGLQSWPATGKARQFRPLRSDCCPRQARFGRFPADPLEDAEKKTSLVSRTESEMRTTTRIVLGWALMFTVASGRMLVHTRMGCVRFSWLPVRCCLLGCGCVSPPGPASRDSLASVSPFDSSQDSHPWQKGDLHRTVRDATDTQSDHSRCVIRHRPNAEGR